MAELKQIDKYNYMPFGTAVIDAYRSLPSTAKMLANSFVGKENITDQNVSKYFSKEDLSVVAELAEKQQSLIEEGKIDARLGQDSSRPNEEYEKGNTKVDATLGQVLNKGNSAQLLNYTEHDTNSLILPQFDPLNPSGKELKDFTQQEKDELLENVTNRKEVRQKLEKERTPFVSPIVDFLTAPPTYNIANTLGKYYYGPPNLAGQRRITDNYNWHLGKGLPMIQEALTMLKDPGEQKNAEGIKWLIETIASNSERAKTPEINFDAPPPYKDGGWNFNPRTGEYLYSASQGPSSQNTGTADPGQGGDFSTTEDNYSDLGFSDNPNDSVFMEEGGQVSQGLDNLYMNTRDSKQKLHNMMGFQSRQYGGGLDDAYMNRRSAFAPPDVNSAFASPMSQGGLPTIYRASGGDYEADDFGNYSQADVDAAMADNNSGAESEEQNAGAGNYPSSFSSGPDPLAGDYYTGPPSVREQSTPAPSTPTDYGKIDMRGVPTYGSINPEDPYNTSLDRGPEEGSPGFNQLGDGLRQGRGNTDSMSRSGRTVLLSTLRDRFGTWPAAEKALAGMSAKSILDFDMAVNGDYRFGGPQGTLEDIFEKQMSGNLDITDLTEQAKYRKIYEEEFEKNQLSGFELAAAGLKDFALDIADKFSIQSNLTDDPYIMDEIAERANAAGLNFQPVNSFAAGLVDFGISALGGLAFPGAGALAKGLSNMTGAGKTIGTYETKDGLSFNVSDTGKFSLNVPLPTDIDYGNDEEPKKESKPVQQKITKTVTKKEKESTPKKSIDLVAMKASNIDKLKSYMNLTKKDLSTSKKDLAITDTSITEEDFAQDRTWQLRKTHTI